MGLTEPQQDGLVVISESVHIVMVEIRKADGSFVFSDTMPVT